MIIYADNTFETFNVDSFELKDNSYSKDEKRDFKTENLLRP